MNDCGTGWITAIQKALIWMSVGAAVTATVLIVWAWKG